MKNYNYDSYEDYFENRNISNDYYSEYNLPKFILDILPSDKSGIILDIGCGFGQLLNALRKNNYTNLEGIDISNTAVNYCKENGLNVELIKGIESFCERSKKKYDLIFMNHVVEHLEKESIIKIISSIRQNILKDDGCLFVSVPNAQSNTDCYWAYEDFTHNLLFTAGSLEYVLKAAGFNKIKFLDKKGIRDSNILYKMIKLFFLSAYSINKKFWNKITSSSYHRPSPVIYTFEIKALAKNG